MKQVVFNGPKDSDDVTLDAVGALEVGDDVYYRGREAVVSASRARALQEAFGDEYDIEVTDAPKGAREQDSTDQPAEGAGGGTGGAGGGPTSEGTATSQSR